MPRPKRYPRLVRRLLQLWTIIAYLLAGTGVVDALHLGSHAHDGQACHAAGDAAAHRAGCGHHGTTTTESGPEGSREDCPVCVGLALFGTRPDVDRPVVVCSDRPIDRIRIVDEAASPLPPLRELHARPPPALNAAS